MDKHSHPAAFHGLQPVLEPFCFTGFRGRYSTSTGRDVVQETGAAPTPGTSEFEPPPPTGLVNQLYAGVESGEWTYEQGLVQALKIFTGEDILPKTVLFRW